MANSSRAPMESQEGPTGPGGTDFPVRLDRCGGHGQGLRERARRLFLGGSPPAVVRRQPDGSRVDPTVILKEAHPPNPQWYDKLFAWAMEHIAEFHNKKVSGYKEKLFNSLDDENKKVLELGIGTGPNIQYYATGPYITVYGVDPNKQMEKYARAAARRAGLPPSNFYFTQAVGEGLPVEDCSMDVVVGTFVLCSVKDVHATLQDGTPLRFLQGILNPLEKCIFDGCHLNRETGKEISKAGFSNVELNMSFVHGFAFINPHMYGVAIK